MLQESVKNIITVPLQDFEGILEIHFTYLWWVLFLFLFFEHTVSRATPNSMLKERALSATETRSATY